MQKLSFLRYLLPLRLRWAAIAVVENHPIFWIISRLIRIFSLIIIFLFPFFFTNFEISWYCSLYRNDFLSTNCYCPNHFLFFHLVKTLWTGRAPMASRHHEIFQFLLLFFLFLLICKYLNFISWFMNGRKFNSNTNKMYEKQTAWLLSICKCFLLKSFLRNRLPDTLLWNVIHRI